MQGNERKLMLLLTLLTVGLTISLFECALSLGGYHIEIETGASLRPYIGRFAVLVVSNNPGEIVEGDLVSVYACSDVGRIVLVRKRIARVEAYWDAITDTVQMWIFLVDGKGNSWGWHPIWAVRGKVELILFRGF